MPSPHSSPSLKLCSKPLLLLQQMNAVLGFKNLEEGDEENCPCGNDLREGLNSFHERLMKHVSLVALQEPSEEVCT